MTAITPYHVHGCWTEGYALRHCEGYRVVGPDGFAGYVEEVWTFEDGGVSALTIEGPERWLCLFPEDLVTLDDAAELLTVRRLRPIGADAFGEAR